MCGIIKPTLSGRFLDSPCFFEFCTRIRVFHYGLIPRQYIGKSAHVAGALNVILAPERVSRRRIPGPCCPASSGDWLWSERCFVPQVVLGNPQRVTDHRRFYGSKAPCVVSRITSALDAAYAGDTSPAWYCKHQCYFKIVERRSVHDSTKRRS